MTRSRAGSNPKSAFVRGCAEDTGGLNPRGCFAEPTTASNDYRSGCSWRKLTWTPPRSLSSFCCCCCWAVAAGLAAGAGTKRAGTFNDLKIRRRWPEGPRSSTGTCTHRDGLGAHGSCSRADLGTDALDVDEPRRRRPALPRGTDGRGRGPHGRLRLLRQHPLVGPVPGARTRIRAPGRLGAVRRRTDREARRVGHLTSRTRPIWAATSAPTRPSGPTEAARRTYGDRDGAPAHARRGTGHDGAATDQPRGGPFVCPPRSSPT